ncbi:hypothetical protein BDV06DRAFT_204015 [Aspergillus oleicola]
MLWRARSAPSHTTTGLSSILTPTYCRQPRNHCLVYARSEEQIYTPVCSMIQSSFDVVFPALFDLLRICGLCSEVRMAVSSFGVILQGLSTTLPTNRISLPTHELRP